MRVRVGTSGFSYDAWKGPFYPAGLPASRFLKFYGERLSTVEINNTFYKAPTEETLQRAVTTVKDAAEQTGALGPLPVGRADQWGRTVGRLGPRRGERLVGEEPFGGLFEHVSHRVT